MAVIKSYKTVVGIEFDACGIRVALLEHGSRGEETVFTLRCAEEVQGVFHNNENLTASLKQMRDTVPIPPNADVVTCLSGRQIYAAQMPFLKLTPREMRTAIRLNLRKTLSFDVESAAIEYQVLSSPAEKPDEQQLLVTAVANTLIANQMRILEKAGIRPTVVDILPTAVANVFHAAAECFSPAGKGPTAVMHIGPSICTLIIDGNGAPFFHRNIYFAAEELYGEARRTDQQFAEERQGILDALTEEVARSIAYYEKTYNVSGTRGLFLIGVYADRLELVDALAAATGFKVDSINLSGRLNDGALEQPAKYALAIALAMRDD